MTMNGFGRTALASGFLIVTLVAPVFSGTEASVPIRSLRSSSNESQVFTVEGVVIDDRQQSAAKVSERIYLQDQTGGIRVVAQESGILMPFGIGDRLRVRGRFFSRRGRARLEAENVEKLGSGPLPTPSIIVAANASSPENLGRLIRVSGRIHLSPEFSTTGRGLSIEDSSGRILVPLSDRYLRNMEFSRMLVSGAKAVVVGIPEHPSSNGQEGIYLRLRELADFQLQPGPHYVQIGGTAVGIAVLAALGCLIARRSQAEKHACELKESQEALTASETRFRTLVESIADLVWEADSNLVYTYCSPNIESILGYTAAELTALTLVDLESPEGVSGTVEALSNAREARSFAPFERSVLTKDGRRITMESSGLILFDSLGNVAGYRGVDRDITARKQLEAEVRQGQKMEAVGQLAGGIAHDFNNTLTVISACTSLLDESSDANVRRYAETMKKAAERSSGMTRQLLAFSRKQVIQPVSLDMSRILRELNRMLRRVISEDIEIAEDFASELWRVKADPGQIEQVVTNLVVNARDAMPKGGTILLKTQNVTIDAGDYVKLTIKDSGHGMDSAIQARIFEPFFTTKGEGKGTGLGLASVYGIVKQSGGVITVQSEIGKGTTFEILLPRTNAGAQTTEATSEFKRQFIGTVLIVEDEESVRLLTSEVLASQGYQVLTASGLEDALSVCREFTGHIDVLLSDVILPKGSGPFVAAEIGVTRPDIKVLYMSGYTGDMIGYHGILESEVNLIYKPFTAGTLIEALDAVLSGLPCSPHSASLAF